jgi:hypothetical protein
MEKTINNHMPLTDIPDPNAEKFIIHDTKNKVSVPIREATFEQLNTAKENSINQRRQLQDNIMQAIIQLQQAAMAEAVFTYELDRRSRTLAVPTARNLIV